MQGNLCDLVGTVCDSVNLALSLAFIAPLDTSGTQVELATLKGLTGSARLQAGVVFGLIPKPGTDKPKLSRPHLALQATVARPDFSYRDPIALGDHKPRYITWDASAELGWKTTGFAVLGSFTFEDSRDPNEPTELCIPSALGPPGSLACSGVVFGEPARARKRIATAELRRVVQAAVARLIVAHDLVEGVTGFEIPIYLMPKLQDGVAGGLSIGYRTDTKRVTAALVIGVVEL